jgi:predicted MFS family arabinose efflux permease
MSPSGASGISRIKATTASWRGRVTFVLGGPARRRAIFLLAAVLSLQSADSGAVGALAPQLEKAFHIGNIELGMLVTVTSLMGALGTLPMGVLTDRTNRVRLLVVSIGAWSVAMVATGLAVSYTMLLVTRLTLGVIMAVAGPTVASLTGDLFPSAERSRIYGFVLTGDLLGAGAGLLIAGDLGAAAGWRVAFFLLAVPSVVLAVLVHRLLPEPARGGQSWLRPGDEHMKPAAAASGLEDGGDRRDGLEAPEAPAPAGSKVRKQASERDDVKPDAGLILQRDPAGMGVWAAARYVLRIPSNRVLIASSALGYFFLAGLRTFALLFARGHFGLSQGVVSLLLIVIGAGAIAGTVLGGRLTDRLIRRRITDARLVVAGVAFVGAAVAFVPGLVSSSVVLSLPILVVAAALLSAPNPALDAARLDIVPSRLWGRAESVRTFARTLLEAAAPLLFGFVSSLVGGAGASVGAGVNASHQAVSPAAARGLEYTFLIMLVPLAASGAILLRSRSTYLRDITTAAASEAGVANPHGKAPPGQLGGQRRE